MILLIFQTVPVRPALRLTFGIRVDFFEFRDRYDNVTSEERQSSWRPWFLPGRREKKETDRSFAWTFASDKVKREWTTTRRPGVFWTVENRAGETATTARGVESRLRNECVVKTVNGRLVNSVWADPRPRYYTFRYSRAPFVAWGVESHSNAIIVFVAVPARAVRFATFGPSSS